MGINIFVILAKEVKQNNKRGRLNPPVYKSLPQTRTKYVRFSLFAFTGKERDEETGYSYFGARYMGHELMTMWLSVDPMADKYPNISPYVYCVWNPVRLVDPDRNDWYVPKGQSTPIFDKNVTSNNCPEGATYIGKTAHWFGQTENDMQYYYHGAEDGALSKQDMTVTIFGDKDGEPTLKSKACLKCLYFTIIIFDLCRYLEYFSYLCTINQTE